MDDLKPKKDRLLHKAYCLTHGLGCLKEWGLLCYFSELTSVVSTEKLRISATNCIHVV